MTIAERERLPNRRYAETFDLRHGDERPTTYRITVGYFAPGRPAEVFVTAPHVGSSQEAVARDGAILLSLAMQFGIPLDVVAGAITREQDGRPSTIIGAVIDQLNQRRQHE